MEKPRGPSECAFSLPASSHARFGRLHARASLRGKTRKISAGGSGRPSTWSSAQKGLCSQHRKSRTWEHKLIKQIVLLKDVGRRIEKCFQVSSLAWDKKNESSSQLLKGSSGAERSL